MREDDREAIRQYFLGDEDGHIYFFYHPRSTEAHNVEDVEHISVVLHPFASKYYRLIYLDTPSLPGSDDRFNMVNGIIKKVDDKPIVIHNELQEKHQMVLGVPQVKQAAARPCGEGVYTILSQDNRAYLVYVIELPRIDGKIKESLHIGSDGVFTIGIYNPYLESEFLAESPHPHFTEELKALFKNQRIIYDNLPTLLNYENSRLAIFKESEFDIKTLKPRLHPLQDTFRTADIFGDLKLQRENYPVEPLFRGEWK